MQATQTIPHDGVSRHYYKPRRATEDTVAAELRKHGFARFEVEATNFPQHLQPELSKFLTEALSELPPDPYEKSGQRKRRFATFVYTPTTAAIANFGLFFDRLGCAKTAYFQPSDYQPEEGDNQRIFDCLTMRQLQSRVPAALIDMNYRIALASGRLPKCPAYIVGFHIIQFEPVGSQLVGASPPVIHRDGELLTFAHLAGRKNIVGGKNIVTKISAADKTIAETSASEILDAFYLEKPGESYVVDDRLVAHYVDAVGKKDPEQWSHRTVILVDFSPIRRVRSIDLEQMTTAEIVDLQQ